jgi:hypothetical protein
MAVRAGQTWRHRKRDLTVEVIEVTHVGSRFESAFVKNTEAYHSWPTYTKNLESRYRLVGVDPMDEPPGEGVNTEAVNDR